MKPEQKTSITLLKTAFALAVFTIVYNIGEGFFSVFFGVKDETLSLFGFGLDSYVEVISGIGVAHMIFRLRQSPVSERDRFERRALLITGIAFYLLAAGLVVGAIIIFINGSRPVTTIPGIVISAISIVTMWLLFRYKLKTGRELESDAIIADARCTLTCFFVSVILLASSLLFLFLGAGYVDAAGSLGIAVFAFKEGKEALDRAELSGSRRTE
ncbi:MAG: cation transporter [Spirochaetes bacterium]|nr:cation transporter [Spirochaetota bacterium]